MKSKLFLIGLLVVVLGCGAADEPAAAPADTSETPAESDGAAVTETDTTLVSVEKYCGSCGQAKGSEACCVESAEKCSECSLAKGSPLCCKVSAEFAGKDLCGKCGQVAGSEDCCKEGAEMCVDCGLAKGAPLCCKLTEKDA